MKYAAVGLGPDDIRLGVGELLSVVASDNPAEGLFVSANVVLIDPTLMATQKVVESNGRKIGVTSVLDPKAIEERPERGYPGWRLKRKLGTVAG